MGSSIEWWFVQGYLDTAEQDRHHVMAAFFRVHDLDGSGPPGAMLLRHAVDETGQDSWHQSQVTRETIALHNRIATQVINTNVQPRLQTLARHRHFAYTAASARHNGIVEEDDGPQVNAAPFSVSWNDFAFGEAPEGLSLRTNLAGGRHADVLLAPQSAWLDARSDQLHPGFGPAFAYQCCPRLHATGVVDGQPVQGQFWIDRQWGQYEGWLLSPKQTGYRVLGWDWFGLNLDDGRDLLISRHRDAATNQAGAMFGVIFRDGQPEECPDITATPVRHWTSPHTAARYPVAWDLDLPQLGLRGRVTPLIEDQEIPVYGTEAIWEGAVQFQGHSQGQSGQGDVSGRGRLELVGYGVPLTLGAHLRRNFARFATGMSAAFGPSRKR